MIKTSRSTATDNCTLSLTVQYLVSYTSLTNFLLFFNIFSIPQRCVNARIHLLRTPPLSVCALTVVGTVYVFEVGLLIVEKGIVPNSKCVPPFVFSLSVRFALVLITALRRRVLPPSGTIASLRWNRCPHAHCRHSFSLSSHPSLSRRTTSPYRGPSLAAADADKNLDDVMCIPAPWDAEALEQFHPGTTPH
jgi:hypothetical protein